LLANDVLSWLIYHYPEGKKMGIGDVVDVSSNVDITAGLPVSFRFDGAGVVHNIQTVRLVSSGIVEQSPVIARHRTLDVCVDSGTGLSVATKSFESTKSRSSTFVSASVFQIELV
jgi:hypothetical protein